MRPNWRESLLDPVVIDVRNECMLYRDSFLKERKRTGKWIILLIGFLYI